MDCLALSLALGWKGMPREIDLSTLRSSKWFNNRMCTNVYNTPMTEERARKWGGWEASTDGVRRFGGLEGAPWEKLVCAAPCADLRDSEYSRLVTRRRISFKQGLPKHAFKRCVLKWKGSQPGQRGAVRLVPGFFAVTHMSRSDIAAAELTFSYL